jgi:hypothetical protein
MWEGEREEWLRWRRLERDVSCPREKQPITDEQLQTVLDARPEAPVSIASDLAESQLGLADRCVVCGKPVTGSYTRRDDRGRPRHRRCP